MATVSTIPGNGNVMSLLYRSSSWSIQLTGDVTADTFVAQLVASSTVTLGTSATYDATYDTTTVVITLSTPQALTLSLGTYTWNITQTTSGNTRTVASGEWAVVSGNVVFNPPLVGYPSGPFNFNSIYWNDGTNSTGASTGNASGNIPLNNGTLNTNLNAQLHNGFRASQSAVADQVPVLNSDGDLVLPKFTTLFDGRVYGTAIHNNANPVTGATNQYIASGTYTPTLFNTTNITSSSPAVCQWIRVGNVVTVSGLFSANTTLTMVLTTLGMSLPIASTFASQSQLGGTAQGQQEAFSVWACYADTSNMRARLDLIGRVATGNNNNVFSFTYLVV